MAIRKISIVGSGVFGIMYGHFLASHFPAGNIRFVADADQSERYGSDPLICNGSACPFKFIPFGTEDPADLVIFSTDPQELGSVIRRIGTQIGKNTVILTLEKDESSRVALSRAFGNERVICGSVRGTDVSCTGGKVTYTDVGFLRFSSYNGQFSDFTDALTSFLDSVGFAYYMTGRAIQSDR